MVRENRKKQRKATGVVDVIKPIIQVIGVGGASGHVLNKMIDCGIGV